MKLRIINEDSLNSLKSNLPSIYKMFSHTDPSEVMLFIGDTSFRDYKEIDNFLLSMDSEKPYFTDFENVKRFYQNLRFLSDSQASEERLWVSLGIHNFWEYIQYRWNIKKKPTFENINQHFFFAYRPRRSFTRNALARLWWIGRLTYDETRDNPFELTEFVCESSDFIMHILERNFSNNLDLIRPLISGLLNARNDGVNINTNLVGELTKYLNLLGGTYIIDCMDEDVLESKIIQKAKDLSGRSRSVFTK